MKKRIFQELLAQETLIPSQLWKYYILSVFFHIIAILVFLSIEMKTPELTLKPEKVQKNRKSNSYGQHIQPAGGVANKPAQPASYSTASSRYHAIPTPSSGSIYRVPIHQSHLHLSGNQYIRMYSKPFLATEKSAGSSFPLPLQYSSDIVPDVMGIIEQYIQRDQIPPEQLVKIEEMVNYFSYEYPPPQGGKPFSITAEVNPCPWQQTHLLLHVGIQGKIVTVDAGLRNRDFIIANELAFVYFPNNKLKK